jgi:hypothetical protein
LTHNTIQSYTTDATRGFHIFSFYASHLAEGISYHSYSLPLKESRVGNIQEEERRKIALIVNGVSHELDVGIEHDQIAPSHTLAHTLRETLGLEGTHKTG